MAHSATTQQPIARWDIPELDLDNARWRSGGQGVGDVQIAFVEGFIAMRNARRTDSPPLIFNPAEWRAFVVRARVGEFDLPGPRPATPAHTARTSPGAPSRSR